MPGAFFESSVTGGLAVTEITSQPRRGFDPALLPAVLTLAWPTMLEQLMQTAVQYIDTAMVGSLGTAATAAVGATTTINWLIICIISACGIGFLSVIARASGAGDAQMVRRASAQAAMIVLIAGSLFTVLATACSSLVPAWMQVDEAIRPMAGQYFLILYLPTLFRAASIIFGTVLRAVGDAKTPMRAGVGANVLNVILNFLLIYPTRTVHLFGRSFSCFGAGWGVAGAAAASAISYAAAGIVITSALWKHPALSPRGLSLRPDGAVLRPWSRVAFPLMVQQFATCMGYIVFAAMVNALGEISTAAHTIANTVESAFYIPGFGMQNAAAALSGAAVGAHDRTRLRALGHTIRTVEVSLMLVSGALLFGFAPAMVRLFTKSPAAIALGSTVLRMVACSEPFYGVSLVTEGMLQGAGQTRVPLLFSLTGMWGVRILGTFLCTRVLGLGLVAAWGCMIANNLLVFTLYLIYLLRGKLDALADGS